MTNQDKKQQAAEAALKYVNAGDVIGVGTGSTVNYFIAALGESGIQIEGAVASSKATQGLLESRGICVFDLNAVDDLPLYVDGADEATETMYLIKGGGGALTREKIVAAASRQFVCIIDDSKRVSVLGKFPLPIEILPLAQSFVARQLAILGGVPRLRMRDSEQYFITDNDNRILDVSGLDITNPIAVETQINQIPGVVSVGLFAQRPADVLLVADNKEVVTLMK